MLTEEQRLRRYGKIGASFVPALMAGDSQRIGEEWMRLVDHPDYKEPDFSDDWLVQLGSYAEDFTLNWHARKTGQPLVHRGQWMDHPDLAYIGCTLDAYRAVDRMVLDCKWRIGFQPVDEARAYYCGQLVVQKACVKAHKAGLLIVHGGAEPREYEAEWSDDYERQVWERVAWFWGRVETLQAPCEIPGIKAPVPAIKEYDMAGNNEWGALADNWLTNKGAYECFNRAAKGLKEMVPADAARAFGHGITASRNKAGSLSIKETRTR